MKGIKLLWLQWSLLVLFEHHCNTICCWNSLCILGWGEEIFLQLRLARKSKPLEILERHFTTKICGVTIDAAKRMPQHLKKELRKRSCYRHTQVCFSFNMLQPVSFVVVFLLPPNYRSYSAIRRFFYYLVAKAKRILHTSGKIRFCS